MLDTLGGLPLHPLVVHATEVIVPAAALAVVLAVLWPRFRRWARYLPLGLCVASVGLVPLSSDSGEALQSRLGETALIETHAQLAEGLLPWVVVLAIVAALLVVWNRSDRTSRSPRQLRWVPVALAVAGVLAATGTTVQAVLVGHSGATAVWSSTASSPR